MPKITLIVPTYNAGELWKEWIGRVQKQSIVIDEVIVIDSSSSDSTASLAEQAGFSVHKIAQADFNHGATRNLGAKLASIDTDIFVFLTQDALLTDENSLGQLVSVFDDIEISAVYGRQLPHINASPLAVHARLFNYPSISRIKDKSSMSSLGIKTVFMSNSFAAYRKSIFNRLGGFPADVILAEDMFLAAKMILSGHKIAYKAEACVYHSHDYTLLEELRRYFDIGVFQQQHPWIQQKFGQASGEGKRFVCSELKYLFKNYPVYLPKAMAMSLVKFVGFKLGLYWYKLPQSWVSLLSMHKGYWKIKGK